MASSLASSTTESLPKIHTNPARQPHQKSPSYAIRPLTSHVGQRRGQTASQGECHVEIVVKIKLDFFNVKTILFVSIKIVLYIYIICESFKQLCNKIYIYNIF